MRSRVIHKYMVLMCISIWLSHVSATNISNGDIEGGVKQSKVPIKPVAKLMLTQEDTAERTLGRTLKDFQHIKNNFSLDLLVIHRLLDDDENFSSIREHRYTNGGINYTSFLDIHGQTVVTTHNYIKFVERIFSVNNMYRDVVGVYTQLTRKNLLRCELDAAKVIIKKLGEFADKYNSCLYNILDGIYQIKGCNLYSEKVPINKRLLEKSGAFFEALYKMYEGKQPYVPNRMYEDKQPYVPRTKKRSFSLVSPKVTNLNLTEKLRHIRISPSTSPKHSPESPSADSPRFSPKSKISHSPRLSPKRKEASPRIVVQKYPKTTAKISPRVPSTKVAQDIDEKVNHQASVLIEKLPYDDSTL